MTKAIGGSQEDRAVSTSVDNNGNIYVTGYFTGFNVDFDPGPSSFILTNSFSFTGSPFLCKFNSNGDFLWAIKFGLSDFSPRDMVLDYLGNPIVCGGNGDFGTTNGGSSTNGRVYKFNPNGTLLWERVIGGRPNSIAAANVNNIQAGTFWIVGSFVGSQDFDPSAGSTNIKTAVGGTDIFILSLDVDTGLGASVQTIGSSGNDYGMGIIINSQGNKFVTGAFSGIVDFNFGTGTTNLTSNGLLDCFVLKLSQSTSISFSSAVSFGGDGNDIGMDVAMDSAVNTYITGSFETTVDFNPSSGISNLISNGGKDLFVNKFDLNLGYLWAQKSGGINNDEGISIVCDNSGNTFSTGYYSGTADFHPGTPVYHLNSFGGSNDIYIWKLNSNGNFILANSYGGNDDDKGYCVTSDTNGNPYSVGFFSGIADFDPGIGVSNLTSNGDKDIYIQLPSTDIPTISASGPLSFCPGEFVTLSSSSLSGNTWNTGETTQSIVVSSPGTYTVSISNGACSFSSSPIFVSLLSTPVTPTISTIEPTTFCSGSFVYLTSSSSTGNTWSNGSTNYFIFVNSSGTYSVTVSNGTCSATSSPIQINVIEYPITPTITASGATSFCPGGFVTLTSSSANGNSWSTGDTTQSIIVNTEGSYIVSNSNGSCISNSDPISISILTAPVAPNISASGSTSFCQGDSVVLTSSSATNNLWSNGETTESIVVNNSGNYVVSVSNGTCSSSSNPVQVDVTPYPIEPTISASGPTSFCPSESVTLTSSNANGNSWNTGDTTQFIVVNTAGSYSVTVSNGNCASTSNPVTIIINPSPIIDTNPTDIQVNIGSQAIFTTTSNATIYQWQVNSGSGFQNITNGGQYSGASTNTLTVINTTMSNHNNYFRCLVSSNNCTVLTNEAKLTVINYSGLSENTNLKVLSIYPNPTTNAITITSSPDYIGKNFMITDNSGRIVLNGNITSENSNVNMEGLTPGLYSLDLGIGFSGTLKFVKQ